MKIETLIGSIGSNFRDDAIEELLLHSRERFNKALHRARRPEAAVGVVKSPLGDLLVALSARGIVLNHYLDDDCAAAAAIGKLRLEFDSIEDHRAVKEIGGEIRRYLAGDANALRRNVDLTLAGSSFQKKILKHLQAVPRGAVVSYQGLGAAAGTPDGARAVGNALHNNPVPIYVPCHRVVSSDGQIGGYGGGPLRKLQLLRSEGFAVNNAATRIPDGAVWGHKSTRIYCRIDCRVAARVGRARIVFFADAGQARRAGMRPCKICRPG